MELNIKNKFTIKYIVWRIIQGVLIILAVNLIYSSSKMSFMVALITTPTIILILWYILQWMFTYFELKDNYFLVKRGILFISSRDIEYSKIQNIDLSAGPLMRIIGLYKVKIWTASSKISINKGRGSSSPDEVLFLDKRDAEWLKEFMLNKNKKNEI